MPNFWLQAFQRQMRVSSGGCEGVALLWEVFEAALGAGVADLESPDEEGVVDDCCD